MEVWKDIQGYEGLYQVSTRGRIKSLERTRKNGGHYKEKILTNKKAKNGRLIIRLCNGNSHKWYLVHRLVLSTFKPIENMELLQVNHNDENPENNHIDNLCWMTRKENINYGTRTERVAKSKSKPIYCVELGKKFESMTNASKELNVKIENISRALRGRRSTAGGYHWKYIN